MMDRLLLQHQINTLEQQAREAHIARLPHSEPRQRTESRQTNVAENQQRTMGPARLSGLQQRMRVA
jgi:hypothetical protein